MCSGAKHSIKVSLWFSWNIKKSVHKCRRTYKHIVKWHAKQAWVGDFRYIIEINKKKKKIIQNEHTRKNTHRYTYTQYQQTLSNYPYLIANFSLTQKSINVIQILTNVVVEPNGFVSRSGCDNLTFHISISILFFYSFFFTHWVLIHKSNW